MDLNTDGTPQPFVVRVEYLVSKPSMFTTFDISNSCAAGGAYFILPSETFPQRKAHMHTHNAVHGVQMWLPCVDNFTARPRWEFEYTVDKVTIS